METAAPSTDPREILTLFGWLALIEALQLINERDPEHRICKFPDLALTDYVARRRDALLHFHSPRWTPHNP